MAGRPLDPEERALWRRVIESVRPLTPRAGKPVPARPSPARPSAAPVAAAPSPVPARRMGRIPPPLPPRLVAKVAMPPDTLDGGWDRRLRRGAVEPDRAIDLHGHTLATAHATLDAALAAALADDVRVLLVVTGKPPRAGETRRGLIRAGIGDWLAHSRHAAAIAAVRNAHPRHGGAGALYLILRRRRDG